MIVVIAEVRFAPSRKDEMTVAADDVQRFCRTLPGCASYTLSFPIGTLGIVLCTEVWASLREFEEHIATADANSALALWRDLMTEVEARLYDVIETNPRPESST